MIFSKPLTSEKCSDTGKFLACFFLQAKHPYDIGFADVQFADRTRTNGNPTQLASAIDALQDRDFLVARLDADDKPHTVIFLRLNGELYVFQSYYGVPNSHTLDFWLKENHFKKGNSILGSIREKKYGGMQYMGTNSGISAAVWTTAQLQKTVPNDINDLITAIRSYGAV